jgi:nucleotide-binding universal stress UspA family protein
MATFHKILVATDFSPHAMEALDYALALSRAFGGSLTLLHVCAPPPYSTPHHGMYIPAPEVMAEIIRSAQQSLAKAKEAVSGVSVDTVQMQGKPATEIVRWAEEHGADLIVLGTHGRHGFRRLVLGSVAEEVVRGAPCPVLTVHLKEADSLAKAV